MSADPAKIVIAADAVRTKKLHAIAKRASEGHEPTVDEARFAASFLASVPLHRLIGWLSVLRDAMECETDAAKVSLFIDNLRG